VTWLFLVIIVVVLSFGLVVFLGAPYLPTLKFQAQAAVDMIGLKPGETLLELGSGDGRVLILAAAAGLNVVGIEINPVLVFVSWLRTRRYRHQVKIVWGNLWQREKWPDADGIFVFLLPKYMKKLDAEITMWHARRDTSLRLVSFAFPIPDKRIVAQRKCGVYLYEYR